MRYKLILGMILFSASLWAQENKKSLTLKQSADLMNEKNRTLKIANKAVSVAASERQGLNAFWYPSVYVSGAYVHLANDIEVKQSLKQFTDPAKDFVHSIIPDDEIISSILDNIGAHSLTFPLLKQNLTSVGANITWPVFTGGKRLQATKIGNRMVDLAKVSRDEAEAVLQTELVSTYYALRLAKQITGVWEETYSALQLHYRNALKLEQNGMLNKAGRLLAQVGMDEAKRELQSARKQVGVAHNALSVLINMEQGIEIEPVSSLFINEDLPEEYYFRDRIASENYEVSKLRLQETMADGQLKISKSAYMPTIALFANQTLYADNLPKNLAPRTMLGVGFTWNIFDGLEREANVRKAGLIRQMLVLGREKIQNELTVLADKLYSDIRDALDNAAALNTTLVMAEELVRIQKKSFQEGMATSADVIDAETMLSKVRIDMLLVFYKYDVALASLLSACGMPEAFWQYSHGGQTEHFMQDIEKNKVNIGYEYE